MIITELRKYDRPRRDPDKPKPEFKHPPVSRGLDISFKGRRYIVRGRSRSKPLTHWKLTPTADRTREGAVIPDIELSTEEIVAIVAEKIGESAANEIAPSSNGSHRGVTGYGFRQSSLSF